MAQVLGNAEAVARIGLARDEFERDLQASIADGRAAARRSTSFPAAPNSATSTRPRPRSRCRRPATAGDLPQDLLRNTFERYWRDFAARASGARTVERLHAVRVAHGRHLRAPGPARSRAGRDRLLLHQRRAAAGMEPVGRSRAARSAPVRLHRRHAARLGRLGLRPLRARPVRLRARRATSRSCSRAGVPAEWLDGAGIAVEHLRTPYGELSYRLKRSGRRIELQVSGGAAPPGGFAFAWPESRNAATGDRQRQGALEWKGTELHFAAAPAARCTTRVAAAQRARGQFASPGHRRGSSLAVHSPSTAPFVAMTFE